MPYFVYILTNKSNTLYIGITSNLEKRIWEHKSKIVKGFTGKYQINTLIYLEEYPNVEEAIAREKQLKNWSRIKKIWLIKMKNPTFTPLL